MTRRETAAIGIIRILQNAGYQAYIAGGAVRDRLLGLAVADIDIAGDAGPDDVEALFDRTERVGKAFGVVLVHYKGVTTEVATFRCDGPYLDGRRPSWVRRATLEEDVARRDFTINGMLYDPQADRLIDRVNGRADLEARLLRAIGDPAARFAEDRLRLFRAIRFAARLDFVIEPATWTALCAAASESAILAPERVFDELTRMLLGPHPGRSLHLLRDSGLLDVWLPEVAALTGVEQPVEYHPEGDAFVHTAGVLEHLLQPSPALAWGALLHDIGKPPTAARDTKGRPIFHRHAAVGEKLVHTVADRLRFSNILREETAALVRGHMRFLDYPQMKTSTRKRFLAQTQFDDHLALHRADCLACHGDLSTYQAIREALEAQPDARCLPPPLLNGHDLMELGVPEGPRIGALLAELRERQLNGELSERGQALVYMRERLEMELGEGTKGRDPS